MSKIRVISEYEFHRAVGEAQMTQNSNEMFGNDASYERTVHRWFKKLSTNDFSLQNAPSG